MIHRLPAWVWGGAALLSAIAGTINAVGILGAFHHGVTHMSGTTSWIGVELAQGNWTQAGHFALVLAAFVLGAALTSLIVRGSELELGHRYGVALLLESGLLAVATLLLMQLMNLAIYLLSIAAGLQNAMASQYSGAIVRTTHVTGVFTDIGIVLGNALRGQRLETRKLTLLITIGLGFATGSVLGAIGYSQMGYQTLWLPVALTGLTGSAYLLVRLSIRNRKGKEKEPISR